MDADTVFKISVPVHLDILRHEFPMLTRYSPQQRQTVFGRRDVRYEELRSHIIVTPPNLTVADITLDPNTPWEDEDDGKRRHGAFLTRDVDATMGGYTVKYSAGTLIDVILEGENQGIALFDFTSGHLVTPEGRNIYNTPHTQLQRRSRRRRGNRSTSRKTRKN
jgi:hypothetical protein